MLAGQTPALKRARLARVLAALCAASWLASSTCGLHVHTHHHDDDDDDGFVPTMTVLPAPGFPLAGPGLVGLREPPGP